MSPHDVLRHLVRTGAVAAPTIPPAAIPVWGPSVIDIAGMNIPIASMILSMIGLAMARGVSAAREGPTPGGKYLTGTLGLILFGLVVENNPKPSVAIAWGIGIGASGIVLFDLLRDRIILMFQGSQATQRKREKADQDSVDKLLADDRAERDLDGDGAR